MSFEWILCTLLLMIIPAIMIYAGYVRQSRCAQVGAKYGYTTQLSLSSEKAWAYAQSACPKRYMVWGVVLAVVDLLLMLLPLGAEPLSIAIYAFTLLLLELLVWGVVVCTVESGLRKLLGIKEG